MDNSSLPSIPGVSAKGLPDAEWTTEHPQWVPATVWAAHAAYEQSHEQSDTSHVQSKCAACTAHIPDLQANTRCSKCKKNVKGKGSQCTDTTASQCKISSSA